MPFNRSHDGELHETATAPQFLSVVLNLLFILRLFVCTEGEY